MVERQRLGLGESVQLATRVPKHLHRAAMLAAITEERAMQEWVAEALAEHLERCRRREVAAK